MDHLKILSINTRGIKNKLKRKAMFSLFKQQKIDIICLQETHITKQDAALWEKEWGGQLFYHSGTAFSKGQAVLVSKNFQGTATVKHNDSRVLVMNFQTTDSTFTLVNIYAPNNSSEKINFFKSLQKKLEENDKNNLIVVGDFNTVVDNNKDIISGRPHCNKEIESLRTLMNNLSLSDMWRTFHDDKRDFTWCKYSPFIARRIDYCFLGEEIAAKCIACNIMPVPHTDHKGIVTELSQADFVRGPGYWRFNNSYLKDKEFVGKMNNKLTDLLEESRTLLENTQDQWDWCKLKIRDFCIDYGKAKSKDKLNKNLEFQNELEKLEQQLVLDADNEDVQNRVIGIKKKLELLSMEKARGAQIRARTKWVEEGEKNTKYFLGLEKHRAKSNVMTHVKNDSGVIVCKQSEILQEQVKFYSNLYSKSNTNTDIKDMVTSFIEAETFPKLDNDEASQCEGLFSEEEIGLALKSMNDGSSPGYDGITTEFLKFFWNKVKAIVTCTFNEAFIKGDLSFTQKQGVIILLHKGKELRRDELSNWRPITLTNTDYKILAKSLAARLGLVIGKLINTDQVGYLKGRNISTVIRTIDDAIQFLNYAKKGGYLLALDYKKAFDSISKEFMLQSLETFGFGEQFQRWVKILITDTVSMINHAGWISEAFPVECGIRQGCPFSPLAFILAVEILAIKIRNSDIAGISLPPKNGKTATLKIKQLADDTTLFLKNKEDVMLASRIINQFSEFSGLKLNINKTKAMPIGTTKGEADLPYVLTEKIKILGIYFKNSEAATNIEENWIGRIEKINNLITQWSKRDLGIYGKIIIIKCFILSQFVFIMQSIGIPAKVLANINRIMYKFIWQRRKTNRKAFEKIKRKVMELEYSKGGVNMININKMQESFYLNWLSKLYTEEDNWTHIPSWYLQKLGSGVNVMDINCRPKCIKPVNDINSPFWREALHAHLNSKQLIRIEDINRENFQKQLLWHNINIQYKGKTLFFSSWKNSGFETVNDMIKENEKRLLSVEEVIQKVNVNPANIIFQYNAVVNALPDAWKRWLTTSGRAEVEQEPIFDIKTYATKPKLIRKMLLEQSTEEVKTSAEGFWRRKMNVAIDESTWQIPHLATKETRLRELQWKIIHNLYPTNILLSKMKVTDDNKCTLCRNEVDFLEHFFFYCPPVKRFWIEVEQFLHGLTGIRTRLQVNDVLLGFSYVGNSKPKAVLNIINHTILIGKMCISIAKKTKENMKIFIIFEQHLRYRQLK